MTVIARAAGDGTGAEVAISVITGGSVGDATGALSVFSAAVTATP